MRRDPAAEGVIVGARSHSRDFGVMDGPENGAKKGGGLDGGREAEG